AIHVDPVEKEPLYHFLPGSEILCIGTAGCNYRCKHCQNWHLSQRPIEDMEIVYDLSPEKAVEMAAGKKIPTISFTYNDPIAFYECVYDIARKAKEKNIRIIWHSNGSLNPRPLKELLKYTDAVTIDLKGFSKKAYENSGAEIAPVLRSLKIIKESGTWLEIVNLVIPSINDDPGEIRNMCQWIRENLGLDIPLHFSRFFLSYKLVNLPPTPISTLENAYAIAKDEGLNYVSIGNVPGHKQNSTFCPDLCLQGAVEKAGLSGQRQRTLIDMMSFPWS
ncbi:MAG: AmmeMemoRadiSam system radical SAM enzyme, partial [Candidatus Eremiobacteraeota bacterium]|nr:AmmeMemoRadiSam system radical SAM enzyme [Candidatus Eremiobacteraeota bacterium]